jgi:DNA-binding transcriptional ArsR family regulator
VSAVRQEQTQEQEDDSAVTEEEIFTTLSNQRRRYVVHALDDESEADIGSLAEQVAAWEYDVDVGELSHDERKRVYTSLQQNHLPKMDDAEIVEFDKDRGTVAPTRAFADVDLYLEVVHGDELPWSQYYLGLSTLAVTVFLAVWLGVQPFTMLSTLEWLGFVVATFAVSAGVHHYYRDHRRLGTGGRPPDVGR